MRREALEDTYGFVCSCTRCKDEERVVSDAAAHKGRAGGKVEGEAVGHGKRGAMSRRSLWTTSEWAGCCFEEEAMNMKGSRVGMMS